MLDVISLDEAKKTALSIQVKSSSETLDIVSACGRISAEDVVSDENLPPFDRSTMDGYALYSRDSFGAGPAVPAMLEIVGEIAMGEVSDITLERGACVRISTGGMLPKGADAVIPVEYTDKGIDGFCYVFKSVAPFENVTKAGDDIRKGQIILPADSAVTPAGAAALAVAGITEVSVYTKIKVGIISTGDELVPCNSEISAGKIRDINSVMLSALCEKHGAIAINYGIVPDDYSLLEHTVAKAVSECDIVLISGGSSAGEKDNTSNVIAALGTVYCHGIAVKPGKPTIIGKISDKAVFGLPGHPAAAYFTAVELVVPLLSGDCRVTERLPLAVNVSSNNGREEFVCVRIADGRAVPVYAKSGIISVLAECDGYIKIGRNTEGLAAGTEVEVFGF